MVDTFNTVNVYGNWAYGYYSGSINFWTIQPSSSTPAAAHILTWTSGTAALDPTMSVDPPPAQGDKERVRIISIDGVADGTIYTDSDTVSPIEAVSGALSVDTFPTLLPEKTYVIDESSSSDGVNWSDWSNTVTKTMAALGVQWNPSDKDASLSLSQSNRRVNKVSADGSPASVRSVNGKTSGRWIFGLNVDAGGSYIGIAIANSTFNLNTYLGSGQDTGYYSTGDVNGDTNGAGSGGTTFGTGDQVACLFDVDLKRLWFSKNGTWVNGDPATNTGGHAWGWTGAVYAVAHMTITAGQVTSAGMNAIAGATALA